MELGLYIVVLPCVFYSLALHHMEERKVCVLMKKSTRSGISVVGEIKSRVLARCDDVCGPTVHHSLQA